MCLSALIKLFFGSHIQNGFGQCKTVLAWAKVRDAPRQELGYFYLFIYFFSVKSCTFKMLCRRYLHDNKVKDIAEGSV